MLNKIKVYLDTSVISYLDQQDAPEKMRETREVWEYLKAGKYEIYISDLVLEELSRCREEKRSILFGYLEQIDYHKISIGADERELAERFIDSGILTKKSLDDCNHIAAAILADCDVIASWNLKHIVNVKTTRGIRAITVLEGYKDILIYPPPSLLEDDSDDEID